MITKSDMLYIPWSEITTDEAQNYKLANTFYNKEGEAVYAYDETNDHLILPRAFAIDKHVVDTTTAPGLRRRMKFAQDKKPYKFQMYAVYDVTAKLLSTGGGILVCRTGGGKTVMGLKISTILKQKTLVLVDTLDLMAQWAIRIKTYVPGARVAFYGGSGKNTKKNQKKLKEAEYVVATFQSIARGVSEDFRTMFGFTIVDECHVASAPTFMKAITMVNAKYRLGLTATPYREDRLQDIFFANIGPTLHSIKKKDVDALGVTVDPDVYVRETFFNPPSLPMVMRWDPVWRVRAEEINHAALLTDLCMSDAHNDVIKDNITKAVAAGRKILCISDRNDQLRSVQQWALSQGIDASIITGDIKDVDKRVAAFTSQVVFSNFKIVEKGLDCPELDALFFLSVRKARSSVEQAVGRVSRNFLGKKKPVVVIFRPKCGVFRGQVSKMLNILDDLGCKINAA